MKDRHACISCGERRDNVDRLSTHPIDWVCGEHCFEEMFVLGWKPAPPKVYWEDVFKALFPTRMAKLTFLVCILWGFIGAHFIGITLGGLIVVLVGAIIISIVGRHLESRGILK